VVWNFFCALTVSGDPHFKIVKILFKGMGESGATKTLVLNIESAQGLGFV